MSSNQNFTQKIIQKNQRQQTPLKTAIEARLSSNKRYASTHFNMNDSQSKLILSEIQYDFNERQVSKNQELMNTVYQNQSKRHKGFFQYQDWVKHNEKCFSHVNRQIVDDLYKILRIINYGQVLLPTGLVYELTQAFLYNNSNWKIIEEVLDRFLEFNNKPDRVNNFRQLRNYRSLKQITQKYKNSVKSTKKERKNSFKSVKQNVEDVFQRNFKQSKVRENQSNKAYCKNVASQVKLCSFRPQINSKYNSERKQNNFVKPERICHHKQKWVYKDKDKQPFERISFKAKLYDSSEFQNNLLGIPGVQDHFCRHKYSFAEKQRIERHLIKPVVLKSSKASKSSLNGLYF